ncbi:MAG TPA: ABC transporter substrate-binding protein [Streptosporangiaceae bacterium]|nr:ABC transporter substrate-binding protein [Streptosporangiaceae bacterium]
MRHPRPRTALRAAFTVLAASSLAACGGIGATGSPNTGAVAGPTGEPITIGFSEPLTGQFSADGQACLKGYQLWAADVNSHGGLLGRPVKLVYYNDNSDPNKTAKIYTRLITQDHVDLTVGPFSTLLTVQAAPVTKKYGYAFVEGQGGGGLVYALHQDNLFAVSAPVLDQLLPFANWAKSQGPGVRPKTAAYAMVADPFADPPVQQVQGIMQKAGITTVFNDAANPVNNSGKLTPAQVTAAIKTTAQQVAAKNPDVVVLGTVDVPSLTTFIGEFRALRFNPKMIIATSGPDQGQAFLSSVGTGNATGIMVPDAWYGSFPDSLNHVMVQEYIAKYGGTASDINADVAESYSVGEVVADAVTAVGLNQHKIIQYLHSGVVLNTVQGLAQWGPGPGGVNLKSVSATSIFQWQAGARFVKVLPAGGDSVQIKAVKPPWVG